MGDALDPIQTRARLVHLVPHRASRDPRYDDMDFAQHVRVLARHGSDRWSTSPCFVWPTLVSHWQASGAHVVWGASCGCIVGRTSCGARRVVRAQRLAYAEYTASLCAIGQFEHLHGAVRHVHTGTAEPLMVFQAGVEVTLDVTDADGDAMHTSYMKKVFPAQWMRVRHAYRDIFVTCQLPPLGCAVAKRKAQRVGKAHMPTQWL